MFELKQILYCKAQRSVPCTGALCIGPRHSFCRAPTFCVAARRSQCQTPVLSALSVSGPGALCVGAPALSVSGSGAFRVAPRRSLCRILALSLSGSGALCVGLQRSLCRAPALCLSGPGAASCSAYKRVQHCRYVSWRLNFRFKC